MEVDPKNNKERRMSSVVRDWVNRLSWKHQGVLFCAMRGVDGFPKVHVSKPLTRMYRRTVLKCADLHGSTGFMANDLLDKTAAIKFMEFQLDSYPLHWLLHFTHAIQIIGYKHPDKDTREFWSGLYLEIVNAMHLYPESENQMDYRLADGIHEGDE